MLSQQMIDDFKVILNTIRYDSTGLIKTPIKELRRALHKEELPPYLQARVQEFFKDYYIGEPSIGLILKLYSNKLRGVRSCKLEEICPELSREQFVEMTIEAPLELIQQLRLDQTPFKRTHWVSAILQKREKEFLRKMIYRMN